MWGAVRLVPLLRAEPITDLRLHDELDSSLQLMEQEMKRHNVSLSRSYKAAVDTIEGDVTPAATSEIEFTITAAAVATAGTYSYSIIFDMATASLKRTAQAGDWIVTDLPG